jgi:F-type H+-transporting ATPase subunit delta
VADNIKSDINVTGLSGRYAKALYDLAESGSSTSEVEKDLIDLNKMIENSSDLKQLIGSPILSRTEQMKAMKSILMKMKTSELTQKFVGVLATNRRLTILKLVISDFQQILSSIRGEMTADVSSAKILKKEQKAHLIKILEGLVDGKVYLNLDVNPDLLGGLVVKIGSKMVDSSIQTKLQHLQLAMRGVG